MSFWKDVRELRDELRKQVAQGQGNRALVSATKARQGAASEPAKPSHRSPPKISPHRGDPPKDRMTVAEYRQLMGTG